MGRQPGEGGGAGEEPVPGPGLPGEVPAPGPSSPTASGAGTAGDASSGSGRAGSGQAGPGSPGSESGASEGPGSESAGAPGRGLAGFVKGGAWDAHPPSAALAAALEGAAGPGWRCEGGSRAEIVGAVRAAAALESWWCAAKLGLIRAAIREDDPRLPGGEYHGDLPDDWSRSLTHDVALALAMSPVSAEKLMQTAWDLGALLPGIGALLEDGTLTYPKARAVNDALGLLGEADKAAAEAMIAGRLGGKTFGQVDKIAARAAITVDPDLAGRTREHAERNRARVILRRERSGAASLLGCELPPAETLAAHAAACARAQVYKDSGAFPGVLMDQFRAMAYLDLLNNIPAEARIAAGPPREGLGAPGEAAFRDEPEPDDPGAPAPEASGGSDCPCDECDGRCAPAADDDGPDDNEPGDDDGFDDGGPGDEGPDDGEPDDGSPGDDSPNGGGVEQGNDETRGPGAGPPGHRPSAAPPPSPPPPQPPSQSPSPSPQSRSPWSAPPGSPAPPKLTDLAIPLATLLGPPGRPGESHGFGPLDPALCRALAALGAASPHTTACVTVTDENGYAIGHGCLTTGRRRAQLPGAPAPPLTALPANLNLTITATKLTKLLQSAAQSRPAGPASPTGWALTPPTIPDQHGPPSSPNQPAEPDDQDEHAPAGDPPWCGTWIITLPSGLQYQVPVEPVPTHDCDHRRESHAYEPNDMLRHLVQIRDRECTHPTCSRHAKDSDFEHAIPYDQGGRTCGCNAGARSRACHQVKQSPGWKVTQPKPGWHQWETPSGRTYTQEPKRYPT
jgi:Domain of unknown function (DUF222)